MKAFKKVIAVILSFIIFKKLICIVCFNIYLCINWTIETYLIKVIYIYVLKSITGSIYFANRSQQKNNSNNEIEFTIYLIVNNNILTCDSFLKVICVL